MNNLVLNRTYRAQPKKRAKIYIGGLDATNFADAASFSNNFREKGQYSQPIVIPLQNILSYETLTRENGDLNIEIEIQGSFAIPLNAFDNGTADYRIGSIIYFIDELNLITGVGKRAFQGNPLNYAYFYVLKTLAAQWNRFTDPIHLDLEGLTDLYSQNFANQRNGVDVLNVRNASNLLSDPANDMVFYNLNYYGNNNRLQKVYVHHSLETINNGGPPDSFQTAINRNVDIKFVSDTTSVPAVVNDLGVGQVTSNTVELMFTDIPESDFYEVYKTNYDNQVEKFYPIQYLVNGNKVITGLQSGTFYTFKVVTRDVNYNKSEDSKIIGVITQ